MKAGAKRSSNPSKDALRSREYRQTHPELRGRNNDYHQKWRASHRESVNAASIRYRKNHPERVREKVARMRIRTREAKAEIYRLLGGKCVKCGFEDVRALQIDHIIAIGNNAKRKKRRGDDLNGYKRILEEIKSGKHNYQLLCANCNWIKRWELNEHDASQKFIVPSPIPLPKEQTKLS